MIHRVHSTDLAEINRVLELMQKPDSEAPQVPTVVKARASAGGGGGVGIPISKTTTSSPTVITVTSTPSLMTGADTDIEVLVDNSGNVLTDERGYALLGVRVSSTIMTGVGDTAVEVLSGS